MSSMKGIQNTITGNFSSIISNNRRFVVPKFQRDYSWDTEQWDDLWQDIETMVNDHDEHYMGYLVLQTKDNKCYNIIDGQQRFTTVLLLVYAAIKCIETLIQQGVDEEENLRRVKNLKLLYMGKEDPVTLMYDNLLTLNRNNNPYFSDYILKLSDLRTRNLTTTEKLMKRCFEYYEGRLAGKYNDGKAYASFIQNVADGLYFTQIVVSDEMNAFRVFETLNARGVQLSSADLLKNYLFSKVDGELTHSSRIDTLERKWSQLTDNIKAEKLPEFLRYYWNIQHKSIRSKLVYKTIRDEIKEDKQVFVLLDDLLRFSDIYMALTDATDDMWTDTEVRENIDLLNLFRLKQPYSLLMSAKAFLDDAGFKNVLKRVITICFRYNVIGDRNPNDQESPFNQLAQYISRERRVDFTLLDSIMVNDDEFKTAFAEKSFPYSSRNVQIMRYILGKIEFFKGSPRLVKYNDDSASIEHIYPQNPSDAWDLDESKMQRFMYRLGNICLLEKNLNRDIQNGDFQNKKVAFEKSAFFYAGKIAQDFEVWDEKSIVRLQQELANAAVSIWRI
ncbi:MAG: DUF262 domain-containing protein [Bacteroidales bacterium]|nr:DUF262 domain-containing protein [Bacteroidales bacterium]